MGYSKDITAIVNSIGILTIEAARFFKKFAQLSPEEQERYKGILESKVLFKIDEIKDSASSLTKTTLEAMATIAESIDNNEKQIQVLDIDMQIIDSEEYQKAVDSGITGEEEIRAKIAEELDTDKRGYSRNKNARDFWSKKREKTGLAFENVKLTTRLNRNQAAVIISNGIYQKINRRTVDVQTITPTQGGSKYIESILKAYRPIVQELDNIVTALYGPNLAGGKPGLEAIELTKVFGPEAMATQFLLRPRGSKVKQVSALPADLETITLDYFKESPVYAIKRQREANKILEDDESLGSFNRKGEATLNDEGEQILGLVMDRFDQKMEEIFVELNAMPDTYQKFSQMFKWLDPGATTTIGQARSARDSLDFLGGNWKKINDIQKLKLPSGKLANPVELRKLIENGMVETHGVRAMSAERLHVEAQDPRNHFAILLAITDMAAESGYPRKTKGKEFLDMIPDETLRNDPQIVEEAKRLDGIDARNLKELQDILIDASANKEIPTWLLMKIVDTFAVVGTASTESEKGKFRAISNSVVAMATKALEGRNWRPATDGNDKLKKSIVKDRYNKKRKGEVGIVFEKITPEASAASTGTYKARVTRANADAVTQLQSQIQNVDKQVAGLQAQMGPLQQRKEQLSIQLKGEQERTAQEQQAQQMAQAQQAPVAAPAPAMTPTASVPKSRFKVIYKK